MPKGISRMTPIFICFFLLAMLGVWVLWDIKKKDYDSHIDENAAQKLRSAEGIAGPNPQMKFISPAPPPNLTSPPPVEKLPASAVPPPALTAAVPLVYLCQHTSSPLPGAIDGDITGWEWKNALPIRNFVHVESHSPALSNTEAKLLWDDQYLYFSAVMDDADVYANNTKHNGMLWFDDVFELFFKPDARKLGYYEFEINPRNATMEMFLPSRGSGGYGRWIGKQPFHVESKVLLRPGTTLNDPSDHDAGWIVEGRIPWADFAPTGGKPEIGAEWKFALCRYDYSVEFDAVDMSSCAPLNKDGFHNYENYATLKFTGPR